MIDSSVIGIIMRYASVVYFTFIMISLHLQEIEVDSTPCVLEILDTAGTEQFASMRDLYIKNGQGFVVCYSLTNHQTFQDIKTMKDQIVRVKGTDKVPILLVANKVDLEPQREVPTVEGMVRHDLHIFNLTGHT